MATLRDIRRRIKGVQSTQQITKAMKMVAAARLRRAQENIINARPYSKKIAEMLKPLISEEDLISNQYFTQREIKTVLVLIVTADRGLCGAFNSNLLKEATKLIDVELKDEGKNAVLYCAGKKGYDHFRKRGYSIYGHLTGVFSGLKVDSALKIARSIVPGYINGDFDKVIVIYNEFKSVIQQKIVREQYLPVPLFESEKELSKYATYIYEPGKIEILNHLLPKHLDSQMWRILLESNASELGARMTAMENATTNAQDLIQSLKLNYNKARQAAITKELLEVVSGANALKSE